MDIWRLALTGNSQPERIPLGPGNYVFPDISPDGKHIVFEDVGQIGVDDSNIFVARFPGGDDRQQVSLNGGSWPRWSPDGEKVVWLEGANLMSASFDPGPPMGMGRPAKVMTLPETSLNGETGQRVRFDLSPVDDRLLVMRPLEGEVAAGGRGGFVVVQNWFEKFREN
jgi:hypothetical protein